MPSLGDEIRGKRFFITGATGFLGSALVRFILDANREQGLGVRLIALTRQTDLRSNDSGLEYVYGDISNFVFPKGEFAGVIHGASSASAPGGRVTYPMEKDAIIAGTRRALEFCQSSGTPRFLYLSSGAVYGRQPRDLRLMPEDFAIPTDADSLYGEAKRICEAACAEYAERYSIQSVIARCFTFVGPEIPLEGPYAAGNFIGQALSGETLMIQGDGKPIRSYLHTSEMALWLWTLLMRGQSNRPYNVGSENPVSIAEVAEAVARVFAEKGKRVAIEIRKPSADNETAPERYVPSTARAREELGLKQEMSLDEAIRATVRALELKSK